MQNMIGIEIISDLIGYKSPKRYIARASFIFNGLDLNGKRVLEVGCGKGALVAWAAMHGASYVLGLEPEMDGSVSGSYYTLQKVISTLCMNTVEISSKRLDEYRFSQPFDIVILYNVINHLDELAVIDMHNNMDSYESFLWVAEKIKRVTTHEGILILADAARSNVWGDLGRRSPFARTIEWSKHQNPAVWQRLFEQVGYETMDLRWSHLYPFGKWSSNYLLHYFTVSHFIMRFQLCRDRTLVGR